MSVNKTVENSKNNFGNVLKRLLSNADKVGNMIPGYDEWEKEHKEKIKKEKK